MPASLRLVVSAALWFCVAFPGTAGAQIYHWRDSSGRLVLSDKPKDPAAQVVATKVYSPAPQDRPAADSRSTPFDAIIEEHAAAHGVDATLVRAVIQAESAYNPRAISVKGAMGLMQLMPGTARDFGVRDPYDPFENIRAGVAYLKELLVRYSQNVELALAAYNAGPAAVERYGAVPPYRETQTYVAKVQRAVEAAPAPKARIYRTIEYVNGRAVPRYTTQQVAGAALVVGRTP